MSFFHCLAMCFAELGSRIPTSGSIYVYTYASLGELAAFTLGWYCLFGGIVGKHRKLQTFS